jgi:hypothetical protein
MVILQLMQIEIMDYIGGIAWRIQHYDKYISILNENVIYATSFVCGT